MLPPLSPKHLLHNRRPHALKAGRDVQLVRLSTAHRWAVYGTTAVLLASGVLWLLAYYFWRGTGDDAAIVHPLEPWAMKIHGAAAIGFTLLVGSLWTQHMRLAWQQRRNRFSAMVLLIVIASLLISGYLLYYASSENLRVWVALMHWIPGLSLPILLALHIWRARRKLR